MSYIHLSVKHYNFHRSAWVVIPACRTTDEKAPALTEDKDKVTCPACLARGRPEHKLGEFGQWPEGEG
jgi:hypothetical protein